MLLWVAWTVAALYNEITPPGPRMVPMDKWTAAGRVLWFTWIEFHVIACICYWTSGASSWVVPALHARRLTATVLTATVPVSSMD